MKTSRPLLIALVSTFCLFSCTKNTTVTSVIICEVSGNSEGSTSLRVDSNWGKITLEGSVYLTQGAIEIQLYRPEDNLAYSHFPEAPCEDYIFKELNAKSGTWFLKYKSYQGLGQINLQLTHTKKN
jgi:hypothetical protein